MNILILAPAYQGHLHASMGPVLTAAHQLSPKGTIDAIVFEASSGCAAASCAMYVGLTRIWRVVSQDFEQTIAPEWIVPTLVELAQKYDVIMAPANTFGKNIMPNLAAVLDVGQVSDVIKILGPRQFERPIYAGNAIEQVESTDAKILLTIRPIAFDAAVMGTSPVPVENCSLIMGHLKDRVTFISVEKPPSQRPDLQSASVVVSGGRGVGEDFSLIEQLADCFGAAVGASRAAVDAGFITNDCQVGQTGKVVAPDLYIAVGISGAIQHWSGMKDSKVIVAINKDAEAPLSKMADYVLIGDLFQVIPELIVAVKKEKETA